jgi:cytoskeletal protein RodZ
MFQSFSGITQDMKVPTNYTHIYGEYPSEFSTLGPSRLNGGTARHEFTPEKTNPFTAIAPKENFEIKPKELIPKAKNEIKSMWGKVKDLTKNLKKEKFLSTSGEISNIELLVLIILLITLGFVIWKVFFEDNTVPAPIKEKYEEHEDYDDDYYSD